MQYTMRNTSYALKPLETHFLVASKRELDAPPQKTHRLTSVFRVRLGLGLGLGLD